MHYHVKHKSLKRAFALPILHNKAVNSMSLPLIFKHLVKYTTLLTYLLLCPSTRVLITSSRSWGKVGHFGTAFNIVQLIAQLMRLHTGQKEGSLSSAHYGNRVSCHWISETIFPVRRMCFSNRLTIHKLTIKVWHGFVIKNWMSKRTYFHVSRSSVVQRGF